MRSSEESEGDACPFSTWDRKLAEKPVCSANARNETCRDSRKLRRICGRFSSNISTLLSLLQKPHSSAENCEPFLCCPLEIHDFNRSVSKALVPRTEGMFVLLRRAAIEGHPPRAKPYQISLSAWFRGYHTCRARNSSTDKAKSVTVNAFFSNAQQNALIRSF